VHAEINIFSQPAHITERERESSSLYPEHIIVIVHLSHCSLARASNVGRKKKMKNGLVASSSVPVVDDFVLKEVTAIKSISNHSERREI
jgi:hypothetical protein